MNKALVELIRRYADKAKEMQQSKAFKAVLYYEDAAKNVLALARQQ